MRRSLFGLGLLTGMLVNPSGPAIGETRAPVDSMKLFVDFARFRGNETDLYVEFYYSFSQRSLTYENDSGAMTAGVDLGLEIRRGDSLVFADRWIVPHTLVDTTDAGMSVNLVSVSAVELGEGDYLATVIGRDRHNAARMDSVSLQIPIRMIDTTQVVLSDLELATRIVQGSPGSSFYKNTLEVIPNAQGIFGEQQVCYVYAEAYNLFAGVAADSYAVQTSVWDAARREVISKRKLRRKSGESAVIVDQIHAGKLPTGTYTLGLAVIDTADRILTASVKKFFVYNSLLGVDSTLGKVTGGAGVNIYAAMSEGDMDREFAYARYEAQKEEVNQYGSLSGVESKAAFLTDFWRKRSPGLRDLYLERVAFANAHYRVLGKEGYKTDRGRIHIIYGNPSDYDRHPNEPQTKPYEVWTYEAIQGGVIFAFVQRVANGEYELVHSTHRNEIHDDQWFVKYAQSAY
jgi:GWxTD domain-containing protein